MPGQRVRPRSANTAFACKLLSFWRFRGVRKLDEGEGGGEKMEASSKRK